MKKDAKINIRILVVMAVFILILPIVFGGFFSDAWNTITGRVSSGDFNLSVSITSSAPPIIYFVSTISAFSIGEGSTQAVTFYYYANDTDGSANIDSSTAAATFIGMTENRTNTSCTESNTMGTDGKNFSCTIVMYYWDYPSPDVWTINVTVSDFNANTAANSSYNFTINPTLSMNFTGGPLLWTGLALSATNTVAESNLTIENIANDNISIRVNASDLLGVTTPSDKIFAENFSIDQTTGCGGTAMVNNTNITISGMYVLRGNQSNESVVNCLTSIPPAISSQTYNSSRAWILTITTG